LNEQELHNLAVGVTGYRFAYAVNVQMGIESFDQFTGQNSRIVRVPVASPIVPSCAIVQKTHDNGGLNILPYCHGKPSGQDGDPSQVIDPVKTKISAVTERSQQILNIFCHANYIFFLHLHSFLFHINTHYGTGEFQT